MGILICGLNGSGKSTVGRTLAQRIGCRFIDVEDLYFRDAALDHIYDDPRSKEEATELLNEMIAEDKRFVFAAVKGDYGDMLLRSLDCAVVIDVPKDIRLKRVYNRSYEKFGERILPGGDLYEKENQFFSAVESRPNDFVEGWLQRTVVCPVIHIDGTLPVEENVEKLVRQLKRYTF